MDRDADGSHSEIVVRVRRDGLVDVRAPRGLESMRIVAGKEAMPHEVGRHVASLVGDVLGLRGADVPGRTARSVWRARLTRMVRRRA
jgi:hypothetical protein